MSVKREVSVNLEPRSPTQEEVSSSTRVESTPYHSIFSQDFRGMVRSVFTSQIDSGLKMRFKVARPTPYIHVRKDLTANTPSTTAAQTTQTPLQHALVTAPSTSTPAPNTTTTTLATLPPLASLSRLMGPKGENWGFARMLTPTFYPPTVPQAGDQHIPPQLANTNPAPTHTQTQPQSIASTPTAYEPPQLVVIPPNTTVKRTTQASPPLGAHDRNINGLKCKKLESHCKSISCLMKDIFAHSKEKNESFRRYLKQVNFLFARLLTR
jgi:hypothetical protein